MRMTAWKKGGKERNAPDVEAETDALCTAFFYDDTVATFAKKSLYLCGGHNPYRYARVQNHIRVTVRSRKREKERITARYSFRSLPVAR